MNLLLLLSALVFAPLAAALDEAHLNMESIQGEGWQGEGLKLDLVYDGNARFSVGAHLEELLAEPIQINGIELDCPDARAGKAGAISCKEGSISVRQSPLGSLGSPLSFDYRVPDDWRLSLGPLQIMDGELEIQARQKPGELMLDFHAKAVSLGWLKSWLPDGWSLAGKLYGEGNLQIRASGSLSLNFDGKLKQLSWSSADDLQVGEDLALDFSLAARNPANTWRGTLELRGLAGQLYSDPVFVPIDAGHPLVMSGDYELAADRRRLKTRKLHIGYAKALDVRGSMDMDVSTGYVHHLGIDIIVDDLQQAYQVLLQPVAIGTPLDDMAVHGRARGSIDMTEGVLRNVEADLLGISLEHNGGLFGLSDVEANLDWQREGSKELSHLGWKTAHVYKIALGSADVLLQMNAGSLRFQPLSVPLLGGSLMLHDLEVNGLLEGAPRWETRADLDGIQLLALSRSMGWPEMQGNLQASIPRVYYKDSVLRMQGALKVDVFDGEVVFQGMELQDPLGVAPVLQTSLSLANLDLKQITQVFSFGRIEGSLEGYVRNLQLVGWEVAGFDADLHSPPGDKRPHRISQRAIDNLTELGNGASVQLSATMLRFFEDFAYDSLALRVKLHGATAELDGVPRSQGGYYIVKGARLPRIDVIGRNHRIAWKELLSRIRDIRFDDMIVE